MQNAAATLREPITVIEESRDENVQHAKVVIHETKAAYSAPVNYSLMTLKEFSDPGEPITVIDEYRVENVKHIKSVI